MTVIGYRSGYPKAGEATSCYLIQDEDTSIVIDLGAGSLSILQKFIELEEIDALILTHYHPDHFSDILCLKQGIMIKQQLGKIKKTLTIYAPEDDFYFKQLKWNTTIKAVKIDQHKEIQFNQLNITFMKTEHTIFGLAVKVTKGQQSLVYTSDTELKPSLVDFSKNCTLLITECSLYKNPSGIAGHMDIEDVKQLVLQSHPENVIITHIPPYGDNTHILNEIQASYSKKCLLARTGLIWQ